MGQDNREEVNLIVRGGNYGCRKYEGDIINPAYPTPTVSDPVIPNRIEPILFYRHSEVGGGPSAIGGYMYRSSTDPCHTNQYIYADWEGILFVSAHLSQLSSFV